MVRSIVLLAVLGAAVAGCAKKAEEVTYVETPTVTAEPAPTGKY